MASPTLRSLARSLGLSHATVSAALSGSGRVKPETVRRVLSAAESAGYRANPLASAVMSEVRRSRNSTFRGLLAAVDIAEPDRPLYAIRYHADVVRGAAERAADLGFKLETFIAGGDGVPIHRLDTILKARGVRGVVLLPAWNEPDVSRLDWSRFAGVYTDYAIERPALHSVYPDHYRAMMMVLLHLRTLGYERPGMFVATHQDERIQYRWQAAYMAFQSNAGRFSRLIPTLKSTGLDGREFTRWFKRHSPDVVLGHRTEAVDWMQAAGASVPETHGFVCLNVVMKHIPCAGLDLQPNLVGSLALEQLVAQLHRNEFGIPAVPSSTTLPARWIDGPTVRARAARPSAPAADPASTKAEMTPLPFGATVTGDRLPRTG
jgi:DNA-binding LacI/PurR family transcriptional regulator